MPALALQQGSQLTLPKVSRNRTDFKQSLDLTHAYLRATSPVHLKYLANMGVRSTMSISIVIDSDLWGLIACHGYGDFGTRVSLPIRELCRTIVSRPEQHPFCISSIFNAKCGTLYKPRFHKRLDARAFVYLIEFKTNIFNIY